MLDSFIKLVHIISAMVYFGLPFTFGRWYGSASAAGNLDQIRLSLDKLINFVQIHMVLSGLLTAGTGFYLAVALKWWRNAVWPDLALFLIAGSLANLLLVLRPALVRTRNVESPMDPLISATRIRIAVFSATHHTLVTLITVLMVFRNHF